jgi:hypothetical protein
VIELKVQSYKWSQNWYKYLITKGQPYRWQNMDSSNQRWIKLKLLSIYKRTFTLRWTWTIKRHSFFHSMLSIMQCVLFLCFEKEKNKLVIYIHNEKWSFASVKWNRMCWLVLVHVNLMSEDKKLWRRNFKHFITFTAYFRPVPL